MFREDEFTPTESYVKTMRSMFGNADRRVRRDFSAMTFEELVDNYMLATRAVNELLHVEGGQIMLEARCDDIAKSTLEVIRNLRQYKTDVVSYFNSLREQAVKR